MQGVEPPPTQGVGPPPAIPPMCNAYRETPEIWGYCLYKMAGGLPSLEAMETVCVQAGTWEKDCRYAWVSGKMQPNSGTSTTDLLAACGDSEDCRFELIDFRPEEDVLDQLKACVEHTGRYANDCATHAMQRWWWAHPDAEEHARIAGQRFAPNVSDKVGYWMAVDVACSGIGDCKLADTGAAQQCEEIAASLVRRPDRCPSATREDLHPDRAPPGPIGGDPSRAPSPGNLTGLDAQGRPAMPPPPGQQPKRSPGG